MFERKNQNVLSAHYTKLIDHDGAATAADADEDDEFITLARADHDLPPTSPSQDNERDIITSNLSKRKQKLGRAKIALLTSGVNKKLVFDEEGRGRAVYDVQEGEEWVREKGGVEGVFAEGRRFAEGERGRMQEADVRDKEEAREKKKEKKRKRKEREKGVSFSFDFFLEKGIHVLISYRRTPGTRVQSLAATQTMAMSRLNSIFRRRMTRTRGSRLRRQSAASSRGRLSRINSMRMRGRLNMMKSWRCGS